MMKRRVVRMKPIKEKNKLIQRKRPRDRAVNILARGSHIERTLVERRKGDLKYQCRMKKQTKAPRMGMKQKKVQSTSKHEVKRKGPKVTTRLKPWEGGIEVLVPCTKIRRMRKQDNNKNGERIWCVKRERRERRIGLGLGGWLQCAERSQIWGDRNVS